MRKKNLELSQNLETECVALSGNGAITFAAVFFWSVEVLEFQSII